jgi:hypothetical protein
VSNPQLCLQKYVRMYVSTYPHLCDAMCADLCLFLNLKRYISFNSESYVVLNREKFEKSFQKMLQKSFALLFGLLFELKYDELWDLSYLESYRQMQPGEQSLGRLLGGRIVVPARCYTTGSSSQALGPGLRFLPFELSGPFWFQPWRSWRFLLRVRSSEFWYLHSDFCIVRNPQLDPLNPRLLDPFFWFLTCLLSPCIMKQHRRGTHDATHLLRSHSQRRRPSCR